MEINDSPVQQFEPNHYRPSWIIQVQPKLIQFGRWNNLSEECDCQDSVWNPLLDFQNWFLLYHKAVLLTEVTWYEKRVLIKPLGVFDNLNDLARRIQNIKGNQRLNPEKLGDTLYFYFQDSENSLQCTYADFNMTENINPPFEGWIFERTKEE